MGNFCFKQCILALILGVFSLNAYEPIFGRPDPYHISHTEGKGLGYSVGYTSLDLFLSPSSKQTCWVPFADLSGHVFNDGNYASNLGLGFRWLDDCHQSWGISGFYDTFQTSQRYYHQVGLGIEALSDTWDVRINGYLPIGRKNTPIYAFVYEDLSPSGFLLNAKTQFAMKGVDAEFGYHFSNLYVGIGPYYYCGKTSATENVFDARNKYALGGRLRVRSTFFNFFTLDAETTYDSRFNWTGQATLGVNIPFDFNFNQCAFFNNYSCILEMIQQPVIRNPMIVVDKIHRFSSDPEILDPTFQP